MILNKWVCWYEGQMAESYAIKQVKKLQVDGLIYLYICVFFLVWGGYDLSTSWACSCLSTGNLSNEELRPGTNSNN